MKMFFIFVLIPFSFARPVNHNSANATAISSHSDCYFSEIRKSAFETKERPVKSVVSTSCSGDIIVMGSLLNEKLAPHFKNAHPLAVLLCRGSGNCDLNFGEPSVVSKWSNVKICEGHADELLRQWGKQAALRDKHIYRTKNSKLQNIDACSMPPELGPSHETSRPPAQSHLSVQGADAIIKEEHLLVHPGIPICRRHADYVAELVTKQSQPPSKKAKVSTSSQDDSYECSNDPTYREPKQKTQRSVLVKDFFKFATSAGESRVCTTKPWAGMIAITRERKARAARNLIQTMMKIMVPEGAEEFKNMVHKKAFMNENWTTGSSKNYETVMKQVAQEFFAAENRRSKLIVLSLVANSTSYLDVVKYIPSLSRYMYQSARVFARRQKGKGVDVMVERKLERFNPEAVQAFVEFITSSTVMIGLPYGIRKARLSNGQKIEIPNSIRQQSATEIIEMWTKICQDNGTPNLLLSPSTMYKILNVCTATKRESTTCVDYFIAHGMEAFDELLRIITTWKTEGLLDHHSSKRLTIDVSETEQYFRVDFRLHVKNYSEVANHCANFALSDPSEKKLASSCSTGSAKHVHNLLCDRCERANQTLQKLEDFAKEFVAESRSALATTHDALKKDAEDTLSRRDEELQLIKQSLSYIFEMKKHLLRSAFTNQERETIISSLADNEAMVTLDFAQKFLPKFHREKQSEYFGKKGISYHVSHITARVGSVYVQHSFVHIYSGSVTQDSTLVILTIAHFLHQLKKVGIKKISLRSDNAGAYHSAAAIGSMHWLNQTTAVDIVSWSFSEAQNGKSSSDRDANRVKHKAKVYVDKGNNIPTSDAFFTALKENPLNGVSIFHGTVIPDIDAGKTEWPGISSLNHFTLETNGVRGRRYSTIGEGVFVEKTALKPIKGSFKFDDQAGSLASKIGSKKDERDAVLSGGETKFWYHPHCTKTSNCVKESVILTDEIEEDVPTTEGTNLFACPEPGCSAVYLTHHNLEKHVLRGQHKKAPERVTERDFAVNLFARFLEGVNRSKSLPILEVALKELKETKEDVSKQQGWALPEKRKRKAFEADVKNFLVECFNEGLNSRSVLSPFAINQRMRRAKNPTGKKRFTVDQILTVPQIAGFMSREADKRKNVHNSGTQGATSSCNRRRRSFRRLHPHRRRRQFQCKTDEQNQKEILFDDDHPDSEWISFMESEEFWTLSEEFYSAVLENFNTIFGKEEDEKMEN